MPEAQPTHLGVVAPFGDYFVCHRSGPEFQGPTVGASWVNGVSETVKGYKLRNLGMAHLGVIFEAVEGYTPVWRDGWWVYESAVLPPPVPVKPKAKSKRKPKAPKK